MKIIKLLKLSLVGLLTNKSRSVLTILGIVIGIAAVIAMMSLGSGAEEDIMGSISSLGTDITRILPGGETQMGMQAFNQTIQTATIGKQDFEYLANELRFPNIEHISPVVNGSQTITKDSYNFIATINGVNEEYFEIYNIEIEYGSIIKKTDVDNNRHTAVVGFGVIKELFPNENRASLIGESISINNLKFTIIGIMEEQESTTIRNPNDEIYIPYTTTIEKVVDTDNYSSISYNVKDSEDFDLTNYRIQKKLAEFRNVELDNLDFRVFTSEDLQQTASQVTSTFTALLSSIAAISLIVGGIGIMNIMLVSVTERTKEIGLRKAVGARRRDILLQFLAESIILTFLGGVLGILFGIGLGTLIGNLMNIFPILTLDSITLATGVSITIGVIFGYYPAYKAAKLNPIDALRHE